MTTYKFLSDIEKRNLFYRWRAFCHYRRHHDIQSVNPDTPQMLRYVTWLADTLDVTELRPQLQAVLHFLRLNRLDRGVDNHAVFSLVKHIEGSTQINEAGAG